MIRSSVDTVYVEKPKKARLYQGDIYRDVEFHLSVYNEENLRLEAKKRFLPYLVILSQDCDLDEDHKCRTEDKYTTQLIESVLVCPAFQSAKFMEGDYLKNFGIVRKHRIDINEFKKYKSNRHFDRFHFLEENKDFQIPALILDFKWFYSIPRDIFYKIYVEKHYLGTLDELFRETLSIRFAHYLSRIGLPDLKGNSLANNGTYHSYE